ncbi:MAG: hypothetical protein GXY83_25450 [Rhodopirellula sp.]|nr:hypothetical protein [Rhodopirellula sp.]
MHVADGLRPETVSVFEGQDGTALYHGGWIRDQTQGRLQMDLSWRELERQIWSSPRGWTLAWLDAYGDKRQPKFAAIFLVAASFRAGDVSLRISREQLERELTKRGRQGKLPYLISAL